MSSIVEKTKPFLEKVKANLAEGKYLPLSDDSANVFLIKATLEDRYVYLQLVQNEFGAKYNGLVFKIKF